jgi:hypothetical protein
MLTATLPAFFPGCDLLNNKPEIDLEQAMDAAVALANAPYVPLLIDEGGLGTASPRGTLDTAVKPGCSFFVNYAAKSEYPFRGWQAKLEGSSVLLAAWDKETGEESGADKVRFVPRNTAGTEAEVFVYVKPEGRLVIGPQGPIAGVRPGFPFTTSYQPDRGLRRRSKCGTYRG